MKEVESNLEKFDATYGNRRQYLQWSVFYALAIFREHGNLSPLTRVWRHLNEYHPQLAKRFLAYLEHHYRTKDMESSWGGVVVGNPMLLLVDDGKITGPQFKANKRLVTKEEGKSLSETIVTKVKLHNMVAFGQPGFSGYVYDFIV